ncbi:MAG TPA: hypothetical protein VMK12_32240, partial [Anaeromyxobacteraceae bacterium]|nr:hypothetical protein [Anaeromyxobacteraceae bacterium]
EGTDRGPCGPHDELSPGRRKRAAKPPRVGYLLDPLVGQAAALAESPADQSARYPDETIKLGTGQADRSWARPRPDSAEAPRCRPGVLSCNRGEGSWVTEVRGFTVSA